MDIKQQQLEQWLEALFNKKYELSKVADDASFRRYFRLHADKDYIVMDAPPAKENASLFIELAKYLQQYNIATPQIYHYDLEQGFIVLEDFGDVTFSKKTNVINYKKAIDILIKLQEVPNSNLKTYNQNTLKNEMLLFKDWYLPYYKKYILNSDEKHQLATLFNNLNLQIIKQPQVWVHRDYHCRNLMIKENNSIGILDFQDSIIGAYSYDLVSLLKDAYYELEDNLYNELLQYYYDNKKLHISYDTFIKDVDLIGVQRHLKVLGIFSRLVFRDKKTQYLNNIPLVKSYLKTMINKYQELSVLKDLL